MEVGNTLSLVDKVVVVTGSSRGLGRAIAMRMASAGADVVVNSRSSRLEAEAVVESIRGLGRRSELVMADVGTAEGAESLISGATERLGRVDVLVNNAGVIIDKPFVEHDEEDWRSAMHSMLDATFYVTRAVVPQMVARGSGRILAQNSIIADRYDFQGVHMSACAAAKAGLFAMLRSLAAEIAHTGVTVNAVAPGIVATEMASEFPEGALEEVRQLIPAGRYGSPEEVASAMLFLASDLAGYITGQTLRVNGGMYMV